MASPLKKTIKMLDDISEIEFDDSNDQQDNYLDDFAIAQKQNSLKIPHKNLMVRLQLLVDLFRFTTPKGYLEVV